MNAQRGSGKGTEHRNETDCPSIIDVQLFLAAASFIDHMLLTLNAMKWDSCAG